MKLLENKTTIITGGSRGIGEAICKKFAENGANVAFTYLSSEERAKKLEAELKKQGVKAKAYKSDAASFKEAEQLVADVLKDFGKIDVLVNNAGITRDNLILRMSEEQWDQVMQANLKSIFNLTKHVTKPMMQQKYGSIVNMTSIIGIGGHAGQSNYAASKAGIIGFTKSIADELGSRNIRCNAIAPGFIQTDMTDALPENAKESYLKQIAMRRFGNPEEVADVALFLASDMSSYVSKQVIRVCGAHER